MLYPLSGQRCVRSTVSLRRCSGRTAGLEWPKFSKGRTGATTKNDEREQET